MPRPTPAQIVESLRDYAVDLKETAGWQTRGTGYMFAPVGQVNHHDAASEAASDATVLNMMINGRGGANPLRGPLCNGWIDSDSKVYLIAYGNANHAGSGEADVLDRVKKGLGPLGDARLDADKDSVVGNTYFWGWECRNAGSGTDVWEQLDAMVRANAALCDVHGWSSNTSIAHREWTARKPDPAGINMFEFRRLIAERMAASGGVQLPEGIDVIGTSRLDDQKAAVRLMYATFLGRAPESQAALDTWVWNLATKGYETTVKEFVALTGFPTP